MDDILADLAAGRISVEQARRALARDQLIHIEALGNLDAFRDARTGIPEVVLAEGKHPADVATITKRLLEVRDVVLVSRLSADAFAKSGLAALDAAHYHEDARLLVARRPGSDPASTKGTVAIITGGTSDLPVAREAAITAQTLGAKVVLEVDCGVAAPARLAPALRRILDANPGALIVAAGREGALATVVSALVPIPVIGLPVSVGYGAGGKGEAALLSMLQSCSPLAVVNIDAGVIAGAMAARIANATRT